MRRNMIETVMGALVLVVAIGFVFLVFQNTSVRTSEDGYRLSMELVDASGLARGTDVRMAGIKVGSVVEQKLDPNTYFARVILEIDGEIKLPVDSSAKVLPDGLLGGVYVQLVAGGSKEMIPNGGELADAEGPINVVDLIGKTIFLAVEHVQEGSSDGFPE